MNISVKFDARGFAVLLLNSGERAYCLAHGKTGKMPVIAF